MKIRLFAVLFAALGLVACATTGGFKAKLQSWMGQDANRLINGLGSAKPNVRPAARQPDVYVAVGREHGGVRELQRVPEHGDSGLGHAVV